MVAKYRERTVRLQVEVSVEELRRIDDYRFVLRLPNRSAAVRALMEAGMSSADDDAASKKPAN